MFKGLQVEIGFEEMDAFIDMIIPNEIIKVRKRSFELVLWSNEAENIHQIKTPSQISVPNNPEKYQSNLTRIEMYQDLHSLLISIHRPSLLIRIES